MKPDLPDGENYRFLDFPQLPSELEQLCLDQLHKPEFFLFDLGRTTAGEDWTFERKLPYFGKLIHVKQCIFEVYDAPDPVKTWLLDNHVIADINARVGVQRSFAGNTLLPHVDNGNVYGMLKQVGERAEEKNYYTSTRQTAWNYLLSDPGPRTCFYRSQQIDDIIESFIVPRSYWHELNVSVLHGVENITADRISLSIAI